MVRLTIEYLDRVRPLVELVKTNRQQFLEANPGLALRDGYAAAGDCSNPNPTIPYVGTSLEQQKEPLHQDVYRLSGLTVNGSPLGMIGKNVKTVISALELTAQSLNLASTALMGTHSAIIRLLTELDQDVDVTYSLRKGTGSYQLIATLPGTSAARMGRDISRSNNRLAQEIIEALCARHTLCTQERIRADKIMPYIIFCTQFPNPAKIDASELNDLVTDLMSSEYQVTEDHLLNEDPYAD